MPLAAGVHGQCRCLHRPRSTSRRARADTARGRPKTPALTLVATQTPARRPEPGKSPDFTALVLSLVRLEAQNTDVVVTISVPHIKGEYNEDEIDLEIGKQSRILRDAVEHAARIWETMRILDWGLFGEAT
jgi:hypothetical protein